MIGIHGEIIVIDNNSSDDSINYLQPMFANVQFITSQTNLGFGKANNWGLQKAKGKYILFLNPDTIIPEDCFTKCLAFIEANTTCGALGVKMIDGQGNFLPESKRSFPSPWVSFCKMVGLGKLFPKSKIFSQYALGYLSANENHAVDVLCGAFMLCKKDLLLQLKGFDENFFMYGEDVDLSYRLQQTGFKNFYFSGTSIIHFKGESAGQQSFKHNKMFYEAMGVFVKKHYSGGKVFLFSFILYFAIILKAFVGFVAKALSGFSQLFYLKQQEIFVLIGDLGDVLQAQILLKQKAKQIIGTTINKTQLQNLSNQQIVFCEGALSFAAIIAAIETLPTKNKYWFMAKGSSCIVSSSSNKNVGAVIFAE